jgi:uncharacterized phage protein gp47/JayE
MPFARPTLTELRNQAAADMAASIPGSDGLLRFSNLGVLAQMQAEANAGHYGYLDYIARQGVPFTAFDEVLEAWAALKGVTRKPATRAVGQAVFTGENGRVVPAGAFVVRGDGLTFTVDADGEVAGGSVTLDVTASIAGSVGNGPAGVVMSLGGAITGVTASGSASTPFTGGADVELDPALRSRMLQAYASPPQGGSESDYVEWSLSQPGVTRAWVQRGGMGAGTLVVLFMMDIAQAAHDGFPQGTDGVATGETRDTAATGDQLALADALYPLQSVTALVYAAAPLPNVIDFDIAGLVAPSDDLKAAIDGAIENALLTSARPGGTTNLSAIESAIAAVSGSAGFVIVDLDASHGTITPGPAGNVVSNAGYLPVLGVVTYV